MAKKVKKATVKLPTFVDSMRKYFTGGKVGDAMTKGIYFSNEGYAFVEMDKFLKFSFPKMEFTEEYQNMSLFELWNLYKEDDKTYKEFSYLINNTFIRLLGKFRVSTLLPIVIGMKYDGVWMSNVVMYDKSVGNLKSETFFKAPNEKEIPMHKLWFKLFHQKMYYLLSFWDTANTVEIKFVVESRRRGILERMKEFWIG